MTDPLENRLRRVLTEAVPEPPAYQAHGSRIRREAQVQRRQRRMPVICASVVAIAVTLGVVANVTGSVPDAPQNSVTSVPAAGGKPYTCPGRTDAGSIRLSDDGVLPERPVLARICSPDGSGWQAPRDALVDPTALQNLVDLTNGLEPALRGGVCTLDDGLSYVLTFQYADGDTASVRGDLFGCHHVIVGAGMRKSNADAPWRAYLRALTVQRSTMSPPDDPEVSFGCLPGDEPSGSSIMPVEPSQGLQAAAVCWSEDRYTQSDPHQFVLSDDQLRQVNEDFAAHGSAENLKFPGACGGDAESLSIVGFNDWGDRVIMSGYCYHFEVQGRWDWQPSDATRHMLEQIVRSAGTEPVAKPTADASPTQVLDAYADMLNARQLESADELRVQPRWSGASSVPNLDIFKFAGAVQTQVDGYRFAVDVIYTVHFVGGDDPTQGAYEDWRFRLVRDSTDEHWRILDDGPLAE